MLSIFPLLFWLCGEVVVLSLAISDMHVSLYKPLSSSCRQRGKQSDRLYMVTVWGVVVLSVAISDMHVSLYKPLPSSCKQR
jgi:hypothetical protein